MSDLTHVPFRNTTLFLTEHNGMPYVPMRPVVEGMGLDWKSQHVKLTQNQRFATSVVEITTQMPGDDQRRATTCRPLRKLPGWLTSISPNKVAPEIRETVIAYQNECDDVLWDYWTTGHASNPRAESAPAVNINDPALAALVKVVVELDQMKQQQAALDRKTDVLEIRVQNVELQHRNGVPEGYLSKSQAHHLYSRGLSEDVFHRALLKIGVTSQKYIHHEEGHDTPSIAYLESEIAPAIEQFINNAKQVSACFCESPLLDYRRFRFIKVNGVEVAV